MSLLWAQSSRTGKDIAKRQTVYLRGGTRKGAGPDPARCCVDRCRRRHRFVEGIALVTGATPVTIVTVGSAITIVTFDPAVTIATPVSTFSSLPISIEHTFDLVV